MVRPARPTLARSAIGRPILLLPDPSALGKSRRAGVPADPREHVALMVDMIVIAFRTDSNRVASFMFATDVSGRNFSFLDGVSGGHHELSRHEGKEEKIEQYKRITRWHVEQFAGLATRPAGISSTTASGRSAISTSRSSNGWASRPSRSATAPGRSRASTTTPRPASFHLPWSGRIRGSPSTAFPPAGVDPPCGLPLAASFAPWLQWSPCC